MNKNMVILLAVVLMIGCGRADRADRKFRGVTEKRDYVSEAMEHLKNSDVVEAIKSFDLAIRQEPNNVDNYLILGQVYMKLEQADRAADTFLAATRVAPDNGEAYYFLALSEAVNGKKDEAVAAAKRSAEIFMQAKNDEMFKKSLSLVQDLSGTPAPAEAAQ